MRSGTEKQIKEIRKLLKSQIVSSSLVGRYQPVAAADHPSGVILYKEGETEGWIAIDKLSGEEVIGASPLTDCIIPLELGNCSYTVQEDRTDEQTIISVLENMLAAYITLEEASLSDFKRDMLGSKQAKSIEVLEKVVQALLNTLEQEGCPATKQLDRRGRLTALQEVSSQILASLTTPSLLVSKAKKRKVPNGYKESLSRKFKQTVRDMAAKALAEEVSASLRKGNETWNPTPSATCPSPSNPNVKGEEQS